MARSGKWDPHEVNRPSPIRRFVTDWFLSVNPSVILLESVQKKFYAYYTNEN